MLQRLRQNFVQGTIFMSDMIRHIKHHQTSSYFGALAFKAESLLQIVTRSDSIGELVHDSLQPRGICRPQLAQPICLLQPNTSDRAHSVCALLRRG